MLIRSNLRLLLLFTSKGLPASNDPVHKSKSTFKNYHGPLSGQNPRSDLGSLLTSSRRPTMLSGISLAHIAWRAFLAIRPEPKSRD
ncbi:hypothetical protein BDV06DRAFT_204385 [Aspergillus oleicola]